MISIIDYFLTGSSPLQPEWSSEYSKSEIRNSYHRFDFNLFPEDDEGLADRLHDEILHDAFAIRNQNRPPSRARTKKMTPKFSKKIFDLCLLMIGNGFHAMDKEQVISVNITGRKEVARLTKFHRDDIKAAIEAAEKHGYFEVLIGGSEHYEGEFIRTATRMIPLNKFHNLRKQVGVLREDVSRKETVKLRATKKETVCKNGKWITKKIKSDLKITEDCSVLKGRLIAINNFNNKFVLKGNNVNENGIINVPGTKRKVSVNLNSYTAIHTNDLAHGGRLFAMSGVQSLPKSERAQLRWDGFSDAVVELDFSGMHPSFLAALEGEQMTRYAYDVGDVTCPPRLPYS
ncbi:hypothetical protein [Pseudophaeobacter sp. A-200-2]|uniref:hypothetical protein n=1 Tax=Pseudophaeobacter sp. A-200-2 TaxID=3098145 RepID=UPI0034D6BDF4